MSERIRKSSFQKIADIDTVNQHLNATAHVVVAIRGIGEQPNNAGSSVTLDPDPNQADTGVRKALVSLQPNAKDMQLWEAMDQASDELAAACANGRKIEILHPFSDATLKSGVDVTVRLVRWS